MFDQDRSSEPLPPWLWIGVPLALWLAPYAALQLGSESWITGESGLIEATTACALLAACAFGAFGLRLALARPGRLLRVWIALGLLGCVYFAGEELSWGQHLLGWETPEPFRSLNDQTETNFHNTSGWVGTLLDQVPRMALTLLAFVAGALVPGLRRLRGRSEPRPGLAGLLWPTLACAPAGLLAVLVGAPEKLAGAFGTTLPASLHVPAGEMKEGFLALFLLVYLATLTLRLRAGERASIPSVARASAGAAPAPREPALGDPEAALPASADAPRRIET